MNMAEIYASTFTYEPGFIDYVEFPEKETPVWILGTKFEIKESSDGEAVRNAFKSLIWMTYRKGFSPIGGTGPTSDTGWGCMLRAGQMMMAQALVRRHLGKGWRWNPETSVQRDRAYLRLLRLFQDKKSSTFSIHQISLMGDQKAVGEWFGPNTVAQALRKIVGYDTWSNIQIHVALDNLVVLNEIEPLFGTESVIQSPVLLVIPFRAGLSDFNQIYTPAIEGHFKMKSSLGILGGRPSHALYFVGIQDDNLVFLDPHTTHAHVDLDVLDPDDSTFHCPRAQRMSISSMDPSIALCFYIEDKDHLNEWIEESQSLMVDTSNRPIFEVIEKRIEYSSIDDDFLSAGTSSAAKFSYRSSDTSDEEFEIL